MKFASRRVDVFLVDRRVPSGRVVGGAGFAVIFFGMMVSGLGAGDAFTSSLGRFSGLTMRSSIIVSGSLNWNWTVLVGWFGVFFGCSGSDCMASSAGCSVGPPGWVSRFVSAFGFCSVWSLSKSWRNRFVA